MPELDLSPLAGKAGLVKEHSVTSDSETTVMRSVSEIRALDEFLSGKEASCDPTKRTNVMRGLFMFRGIARNFKNGT